MMGVHQPGDDYRIALYTSQASLGPATTHYTAKGEVIAPGYTAGGQSLRGYVCDMHGHVSYYDWDDPLWPHATIKARGALIYNATKEGQAMAVLDFGGEITSSNGPFTVQFDPPGATAIIRLD